MSGISVRAIAPFVGESEDELASRRGRVGRHVCRDIVDVEERAIVGREPFHDVRVEPDQRRTRQRGRHGADRFGMRGDLDDSGGLLARPRGHPVELLRDAFQDGADRHELTRDVGPVHAEREDDSDPATERGVVQDFRVGNVHPRSSNERSPRSQTAVRLTIPSDTSLMAQKWPTDKRPPLKRLLHEDDYLPIVLGASSLNVAGAHVERTGRHLLLCRVEGEPSEAEIACALLQGGEHGSAASLSLPLRMDPHAFQFGMPAPDRPQCAHRNYPSVDVVDQELAADLDIARLDVIEISVQRFPIRSLYQGARPSEGEFVEGSNLGLVGAKKTPDQPT